MKIEANLLLDDGELEALSHYLGKAMITEQVYSDSEYESCMLGFKNELQRIANRAFQKGRLYGRDKEN